MGHRDCFGFFCFGTNFISRGYDAEDRHRLYVNDSAKSRTDMTGEFQASGTRLAADEVLGVHTFQSHGTQGQNHNFNGCEIIQKHFLEGTNNKRIGIKLRSKSILRSGMNIVNENNDNIGKITSGSYSPNLNISIGIAYVNKKLFEKSKNFFCIIRNNNEKLEICDLPFLKHKYKR